MNVANDNVTALEGNWLQSCGPSDDAHYDIISITYLGNILMSNIEKYEDAGCSIPLSFFSNPTAYGVFTVSEIVLITGGLEANIIGFNVTRFIGAHFIINKYTIFISMEIACISAMRRI